MEQYTETFGPKSSIGMLGEKSLHSALKNWYSQPGDLLEAEVDGFQIDLKRPGLLIEIQTAGFSSLKRKLKTLLEKHCVRLVYPIAEEKWIVRVEADSVTRIGRRKSPKRGNIYQIFSELVSIPGLMSHPRFSLEVLFIREEEIRCHDGKGSRRRKGASIVDRCLIEVISRRLYANPSEFLSLIPPDLPEPFSTRDLAESIDRPRWLAQKMAYCLRQMGIIEVAGKNRNSLLYAYIRRHGLFL